LEQTGVLPLQPPQQAALSMHSLLHGFCPDGQLDAQTAPLHPIVHVIMVGCVHVPAPLQTAAVDATPPVQDAAAPHATVVPGNTQLVRLVPSHFPAQAPVPPQGVRGVVTAVQVPRLVELAQDSHWPSQATLQQTPSELQTWLAQALSEVQAAPFAAGAAPPIPPPPTPAPPAPEAPPEAAPPPNPPLPPDPAAPVLPLVAADPPAPMIPPEAAPPTPSPPVPWADPPLPEPPTPPLRPPPEGGPSKPPSRGLERGPPPHEIATNPTTSSVAEKTALGRRRMRLPFMK
jgi:hypothetical protein